MAAESLAALSLASSIVQFIDFGCRLFSKSHELYVEGFVTESVQLETISETVGRFAKDLIVTPPRKDLLSKDEADLLTLAEICEEIAEDFKLLLSQLRVKGGGHKWQSLRVSLKRLWKSDDIERMGQRLDRASNQLTSCLVKILKYGYSLLTPATVLLTDI